MEAGMPPTGGPPPGGTAPPPGGAPPPGYPPQGYPPGQYTTEPDPPKSGGPGPGWWVGAIVVALLLGAGGYLLGQSNGESSEKDKYAAGQPAYQQIYDQGFAAGQGKGQAQGQQQGAAEGKKAGFEEGQASGKAEGTAAGADQALGGFNSWEPGAPYIVRVQQGPSKEVPWTITTRTQMQEGTAYALCQDAPTSVCTKVESSSGGTSSDG